MGTVQEEAGVGERPGVPGGGSRAGRSGEGARSALEHLVQQQSSREAQRPRDEAAPPLPGKAQR